ARAARRRATSAGRGRARAGSWLDQDLQRFTSRHEVEGASNVGQPHAMCYQPIWVERFGLEQVNRSPDQVRSMVKRTDQRQFVVMHLARVEANRRSWRAATEEYHSPSAARRRDRLLPDLRNTSGVHGDVSAPAPRQLLDLGHDVGRGRGVETLADSQPLHLAEAPARLA